MEFENRIKAVEVLALASATKLFSCWAARSWGRNERRISVIPGSN